MTHLHETVAPAGAAAVSCVIGFNLHEMLGIAGQIVGLVSGVISIAWVAYQMYRASRRK